MGEFIVFPFFLVSSDENVLLKNETFPMGGNSPFSLCVSLQDRRTTQLFCFRQTYPTTAGKSLLKGNNSFKYTKFTYLMTIIITS